MESIQEGEVPCKREVLTEQDHFNEYLITRLRTQWGVDLDYIAERFGKKYRSYLLEVSQPYVKDQYAKRNGSVLILTDKGKFVSDSVFRDLMKTQ